jgi:hypothetical protein
MILLFRHFDSILLMIPPLPSYFSETFFLYWYDARGIWSVLFFFSSYSMTSSQPRNTQNSVNNLVNLKNKEMIYKLSILVKIFDTTTFSLQSIILQIRKIVLTMQHSVFIHLLYKKRMCIKLSILMKHSTKTLLVTSFTCLKIYFFPQLLLTTVLSINILCRN